MPPFSRTLTGTPKQLTGLQASCKFFPLSSVGMNPNSAPVKEGVHLTRYGRVLAA